MYFESEFSRPRTRGHPPAKAENTGLITHPALTQGSKDRGFLTILRESVDPLASPLRCWRIPYEFVISSTNDAFFPPLCNLGSLAFNLVKGCC